MTLDYIDWDIGGVTVINLIGRLTLGQGTHRFREAIDDVMGRGSRDILLNFDEVFYIDSSGLGELLAARKHIDAAGGRLKLMKLSQLNRNLIYTTRLHLLFEVFEQEETAVASFATA